MNNGVPSESLNILKNPKFFDILTIQELDKLIVDELPSRKVIFLSACGRLVKNCQTASFNLLVNDIAGTGKDYVVSKTLSLLPPLSYIRKTRISPTAFTYWHNKKFEPEWTWDGRVFYLEDISENVLNGDVFKVMCSSGSNATITIHQKAYDVEIEGKPVMIVTTANSTPNPELTRRFSILNLDGSQNQTRKILERHSEYREMGLSPKINAAFIQAQVFLDRVSIKIPFAKKLFQHFPTDNIIMRTLYPRFLDYIQASCAFHQYQRKQDKEGYYLAEGSDYDLARECFLTLCSNKFMIPLTIAQKSILKVFEDAGSHALFSATEVLPMLKGTLSSISNIQNNLRVLSRYGLLQEQVMKDSLNRDISKFGLPESYSPLDKISLPTFKELGIIP